MNCNGSTKGIVLPIFAILSMGIAGATTIAIESPSQVDAEAEFTINITASATTDAYYTVFVLSFSENILSAADFTLGEFLSGDAIETNYNWSIDQDEGEITFVETRYDSTETGITTTEEKIIAGITFNGVGQGVSSLTLSNVLIADSSDQTIVKCNSTSREFCEDSSVLVGAVLPGDTDGDLDVDYYDLLALAVAYGSSTGDASYNAAADFNSDGDVDYTDLLTLAVNYGTSA